MEKPLAIAPIAAPQAPTGFASASISRRRFGLLGVASAAALVGCGGDDDPASAEAARPQGTLSLDPGAKAANPDTFEGFEWYRWTFPIDPALDTVAPAGEGTGRFYVRLHAPAAGVAAAGGYPLVANLGGLGNDANMVSNFYARTGSQLWANAAFQAKYPCYVMTVTIPWEACVNHEAEMAYMFQIGQAIRSIAARFGNVDMTRIYATGISQGAGWSYEAAAAQPDLFAGLFINSGTMVHTTWGDDAVQVDKIQNVNLYIAHGSRDIYIPPNEAYRAYNAFRARGRNNVRLDIVNAGHGLSGTDFLPTATPLTTVLPWQDWLFSQRKGAAFVGPVLNERPYSEYLWAGYQVLPEVASWATDLPYATWVEPLDNPTWRAIQTTRAVGLSSGAGTGAGGLVIGRIRIGDETQTTYDDPSTLAQGIRKGASVCMTIQGYTGAYGDDLAAFQREWAVDWAILSGEVTNVRITTAASPAPIARPGTVNLTNGGGPNTNNSLATGNVLDGKQVYLQVTTADASAAGRLKVYVRFSRRQGVANRGSEEFASYYHVIDLAVG